MFFLESKNKWIPIKKAITFFILKIEIQKDFILELLSLGSKYFPSGSEKLIVLSHRTGSFAMKTKEVFRFSVFLYILCEDYFQPNVIGEIFFFSFKRFYMDPTTAHL